MPVAIFSTYNKQGLIPFMEGLSKESFDMYATADVSTTYAESTGKHLPSLWDLVEHEFNVMPDNDLDVANKIASLLQLKKNVDIICVNLRPKTPNGEPDFQGLSILEGAIIGNLVVTNPGSYDAVLNNIRYNVPNVLDLMNHLEAQKVTHLADHYAGKIATQH